jgi:gliding motility-associated-like protein
VITGGTVGTPYTVTARNTSNCTSVASSSFTVISTTQLPTPAQPTVDTVAATCSAAGSMSVTNYDSSYTYTFSPAGPIVGADGTVTGVVNGVSYEVLVTNSNNCNSLPTTFTQASFICANNDSVGPIVSSTTATTNVVNVLANDTFNGNPLVLADVNLTVVNPNPNLRLNADGSVDVLGNTPEGTYVLVYQICEKTNPANCKTATVTVTVVAPVIVATNDDYSNQPIDSSKGTVLDILANDRLNNGTVSAPQVVITIVDANGIAGVTVDAQGKVTIPTGTPVGTYVITYRICDVVNPNNCATATITIVVKDPCDFDDSASSCDILVHNAFSPNNDGRNEVFLIERIENYPDNTVEIYNRWGVLVFEVSGYDNASKVFVGLSEGRVTVNKADGLPNGTYYYVVKYKKPISGVMNQKAGFLYLSR